MKRSLVLILAGVLGAALCIFCFLFFSPGDITGIDQKTITVIDDDIYYLGYYENAFWKGAYGSLALLKYDPETDEEQRVCSIHTTYYDRPVYSPECIWYQAENGLRSCSLSGGTEKLEIRSRDGSVITPVAYFGGELVLERYYPQTDDPARTYVYSVWNHVTKEERILSENRFGWDVFDWNGEWLIYSVSAAHDRQNVFCLENGETSYLMRGRYAGFVLTGGAACWTTIPSDWMDSSPSDSTELCWKQIGQENVSALDISYMGTVGRLFPADGKVCLLAKAGTAQNTASNRDWSLYLFDPVSGTVKSAGFFPELPYGTPTGPELVYVKGKWRIFSTEGGRRSFSEIPIDP